MALVCSPMGFGKTHFVNIHSDSIYLDGDKVLKEAGIDNKNMYWYDGLYSDKIQPIIKCLNKKISEGYIVLYSPNPTLISSNFINGQMIILYDQDTEGRWNKLQNRNDFCPSQERFDREEEIYKRCINEILMHPYLNFRYLSTFAQLIPKRVAIAGLARAGKDTIGGYLIQEHHFTRVAFSDPLYEILYSAQEICGFEKQKDRKFLQWVGTEWAREQDQNIWVRLALKKINSNHLLEPVVITDVRYINELESLKRNGFILVRVKRDTTNATDFGNGSKLHPSETEMLTVPDEDFDVVIDNTGTLEQLYQEIENKLVSSFQ